MSRNIKDRLVVQAKPKEIYSTCKLHSDTIAGTRTYTFFVKTHRIHRRWTFPATGGWPLRTMEVRLIPARSHRVVLRLPSSVALGLVDLDASSAKFPAAHLTRNRGRADGTCVCCRCGQPLESRFVILRKQMTRKKNTVYMIIVG